MGVLGIIACIIVGIIYGVEHARQDNNGTSTRQHPRVKRSTPPQGNPCARKYGGIELNYTKGATTSFTFDLCAVINCGQRNSSWRGYDLYLCAPPAVVEDCEEGGTHPWSTICSDWGQVTKWTGGSWAPNPHYLSSQQRGWWDKVSFQRDFSARQNPVTLSLKGVTESSYKKKVVSMWVGVDQSGADSKGLITIYLIDPPIKKNKTNETTAGNKDSLKDKKPLVIEMDYTKMDVEDLVERAVGFGEENLWLTWMWNTAKTLGMEDCVACARARPQMEIEPAPLIRADSRGFNCMLNLTKQKVVKDCSVLGAIFPAIKGEAEGGYFTPRKDEYTCFNFTRGRLRIGNIDRSWCNETELAAEGLGKQARQGLFWYCGEKQMYSRIMNGSVGLCALVRLRVPVTLIGH
ncbi:MAG: hypothetical protein ACRDDA_00940, partial [Aeromonas sp.]